MNLWKISQRTNNQIYDVYRNAVVAAETEERARNQHPNGAMSPWGADEAESWVSDPSLVLVTLLGEAVPGLVGGVICADYNAS